MHIYFAVIKYSNKRLDTIQYCSDHGSKTNFYGSDDFKLILINLKAMNTYYIIKTYDFKSYISTCIL